MKDEVKKVIHRIESLPSAPAVATNILNALTVAHPDMDRVIRLVETDQALALRLLRVVNSTYYGLRNKVGTIRRAVTLLGMERLRCMLLSVTVSESLIKELRRHARLDQQRLWEHSLGCAVCCELLAERICPQRSGEAFAVGLLHDVGKLILMECAPEAYQELEKHCEDQGVPPVRIEEEWLGTDHPTVGKWLAEKWELPRILRDPIWWHHHGPDVLSLMEVPEPDIVTLSLIVSLADHLVHDLMADGLCLEQMGAPDPEILGALGLNLEECEAIKSEIGKRYSARTALLDLQQDELSFYFSALQRANQQLAKLAAQGTRFGQADRIKRRIQKLASLREDLQGAKETSSVLEKLAGELPQILEAPEGLVFILDPRTKSLMGCGWNSDGAGEVFLITKENGDAQNGLARLPDGLRRLLSSFSRRYSFSANGKPLDQLIQFHHPYVAVPVMIDGCVSGEVVVLEKALFAEEVQDGPDLSVYKTLGQVVGAALSRARLTEEARETSERLTRALAEAGWAMKKLREARRQYREEKERLAVTLESIGDAVIASDTEGRITLFNAAAESLTGWKADEAQGKLLSEVLPLIRTSEEAASFDPVAWVLQRKKALELANDLEVRSRDGRRKQVGLSAAPIPGKDEEIVGVILAVRDLTYQKRMEAEVLRVRKLDSVRILAGGIAHDFNNIMMGILGNLNLAKMFVHQPEKVEQRLAEAEKAVNRAKELTQQLLTVAKGGTPVRKTVSIPDLVKENADFALSGSNIRLKMEIAEDLWPVDGDVGQISQVISNLLINARQAMPEGGTIWVRARNEVISEDQGIPVPEGRYVHIEIQDTGVGIKEEHLDRIFDPYFTTKDRGSEKGTGLGLAIVYSIVRRHGGGVQVESREGEGTCFHLYLPAGEESPVVLDDDELPLKKGKGRILVMDDEESVLNIVQEMLSHLGYQVDLAFDGTEAVRLYKKAKAEGKPYDVVILDLTVRGGMGARGALDEIRRFDPDVRAIVSSGYVQDDIIDRYMEHGFLGVITKPYTIRKLGETLHRVLNVGERRKNPRKPVNVPVTVETEDRSILGRTKNLSEKGVLIDCRDPVGPDAEVQLTMQTNGKESVSLRGRVVWVRANSTNGSRTSHLVGVRFEEVGDETREKLRELLDEVR